MWHCFYALHFHWLQSAGHGSCVTWMHPAPGAVGLRLPECFVGFASPKTIVADHGPKRIKWDWQIDPSPTTLISVCVGFDLGPILCALLRTSAQDNARGR